MVVQQYAPGVMSMSGHGEQLAGRHPPATTVDLHDVLGPLAFHRQVPIWSQVYDLLRDKIADLSLPPLYGLSEKEIAQVLSISRTPVREALIRLSEEGLVDIYPQYGTFVSPIRIEGLLSAQFIRESLECSVIRELATRATSAIVVRIGDLIDEQARAVEAGDHRRFYEYDERMHQAFSTASSRQQVWRFIQSAKVQVDRVRHLVLPQELGFRKLVEEHRAILGAIAGGAPERADAAMRTHLQGLVNALPDIQAKYPDYFETANQRPLRTDKGR
jgi:GntR family transcriptional regulator, rspAB operon transcriptional repressor